MATRGSAKAWPAGLGSVVCAVLLVSCGRGGSGGLSRTTLQVKGSDTMVNLAQAWAEHYARIDTSVSIEISGGGSGVGIAALTRGAVDMANASRDMRHNEIEQARSNTGKEPVEFTAGYDALAVFVHRDNPLEVIHIEQLAAIFDEHGSVTRWSQIGVDIPGAGERIVRVSRQSSSGTYEFFREYVLENRDFKLGSLDMNGSKEVVELIGNTRTAIGYSGMGYATDKVKMVGIIPRGTEEVVMPCVEAVYSKRYPLARALHLYTLGEPQGALKRYIEWILSPHGQRLVEETGYVPSRTGGTSIPPAPVVDG